MPARAEQGAGPFLRTEWISQPILQSGDQTSPSTEPHQEHEACKGLLWIFRKTISIG
jgi:hypothetical protein